MLATPPEANVRAGLITKRSFSSTSGAKKSLLDMTPFFDETVSVPNSKLVPLVAGVASDAIAPSSRRSRPSGGPVDTVASVYVHGACNARCDPADSQFFIAGDLVYVVANKNKEEFFAASEAWVAENQASKFVAGILGTCIENGEKDSSFVRVFVDNMFNTMLSCC